MRSENPVVEYRPDMQVPVHVQWVITLFIYLLGVLTYGIFYFDSMFLDGDSPWHLAAGDYIRSIGAIPDKDPWGYTNADMRWYNISWLFDVAISWIHSLVGLNGLLAVNVLLAALTPAVLARISFRSGAGVIAILVSSSVALIMLKACFALRPQQFALLLIALILLALYKYRIERTTKIWLIPALTLLLVNVHGSFLLVLIILGAFWFEAMVLKDWPRVKTLTLVGIACLAAIFANPYTYKIYYASWLTITSEIGKNHIVEWQPASLSGHPHIYLYLLIALLVPLFYRIRIPLADKLLLAFWVVMALNSARYNVVLTLFITPFLALFLSTLVSQFSKLQQTNQTIQSDLNDPKAVRALWVVTAIAAAFLLCPVSRDLAWKKELYDPEKYPVKEIAYLMDHSNGVRIMNHYNYGGYMLYQSAGQLKPFVDGRADTNYSKAFLREYVDVEAFNYGWEDILGKYGVELVLLPSDHENIEAISHSPNWQELYKGPVATIYKRGRGKPQPL